MRVQLTKITLAASIALALTFTLSCSDDKDDGGDGGLGACTYPARDGVEACMKLISGMTADELKAKCSEDGGTFGDTCKANPAKVLECTPGGKVQLEVSLYTNNPDIPVSYFTCQMMGMENR